MFVTPFEISFSALFPCGDSMVCIIDDREDVWSYAQNLIHVKPYVWFKDVGDINGIHLPSPPIPNEQLIPPISEKEFEEQLEIENQRKIEEISAAEGTRGEKRKLDEDADADFNEEIDQEENKKRLKDEEQIMTEPETITPPITTDAHFLQDQDDYLSKLEVLLKQVHQKFYADYDVWLHNRTRDMPDLKEILPEMRREILKGQSICFSRLMPIGYPLEKHRATIIAKAMGATVTADLQIDDNGDCLTTHVVAGQQHTEKVKRAMKYNIRIVTPEWLIDCYEQWERKPEANYQLAPDYEVRKSRLFTRELPRSGLTEHYLNNEQTESKNVNNSNVRNRNSSKNQRATTNDDDAMDELVFDKKYDFSIPADELFDMEDEMNQFCNEDDDDEVEPNALPKKQETTSANPDNVDNEFDSDSSTEEEFLLSKTNDEDRLVNSDEEQLSDDEAPHGWKVKLKLRKNK